MTSTATEVTQVQSLAAIRNFIRVAVSCVTYLRGLCSDESYQPRQFLGLQLKQLVRSSPEADVISQWMEEGAFDALNKGYLKALSLCIYTPNCEELLESYCFTLSYSADGQRAALTFTGNSQSDGTVRSATTAVMRSRRKRHTRQEVQQALAGIITKLVEVVEGLPPLLCERVLAMQLTYYEDVTPTTYEPPCFAPASAHLVSLHQQEQKRSTNIASLDTGHHMMSITIRHRFFDQLSSRVSTLRENNSSMSRSSIEPPCSATRAETEENHGNVTSVVHTRTYTLHELLRESSVSQTEDGGPSTEELAFLLFTSFVVTRSPAVYRGRISMGEVADYLRVSCPLEITLDVARGMLRRLEAEGVVAAEGPQEWAVRPRPAASLATSLLAHRQVLPLLSAQIRQDLERLLGADKTMRMSVVAKRKRPRCTV